MTYSEAFNRLTAAGLVCSVSLRRDVPVELLFIDYGNWNHFCNIDDAGNIDADAAADIEELY